jgi:hypothetical protein
MQTLYVTANDANIILVSVLQYQYHNVSLMDTLSKTLFNSSDPRTYPRFAVLGSSMAFLGIMSFSFFSYRWHHLDPATKNDIASPERSAVPHQMTKAMKNGPIIMNARRYQTLQGQEGLGVDHEVWLKEKKASQTPEPLPKNM